MGNLVTVILVGGASRRMGRDKAMLSFDGKSMCQTLINKYAPISEAVAYCSNEKGRFSFEGASEILDRYPNMGPLNGIISAFEEFDCDEIFMTGTDIPNGEIALVEKLSKLCEGFDACVISHGVKGREPLFAIYKRPCYDIAKSLLDEGRKALGVLLDRADTNFVTDENLKEFDLDKILENVNTTEDYERVCK